MADRNIRLTLELQDKLFAEVAASANRAAEAIDKVDKITKRFGTDGRASGEQVATGVGGAERVTMKLKGTIDKTGESMRRLGQLTKQELLAVERQLMQTKTAFDRYAESAERAQRAGGGGRGAGGGMPAGIMRGAGLAMAGRGLGVAGNLADMAAGGERTREGAGLRAGGGILAGAGMGAAAGSAVLPGIGTAIGAVAGAAMGAVNSLNDLEYAISGVDTAADTAAADAMGRRIQSRTRTNREMHLAGRQAAFRIEDQQAAANSETPEQTAVRLQRTMDQLMQYTDQQRRMTTSGNATPETKANMAAEVAQSSERQVELAKQLAALTEKSMKDKIDGAKSELQATEKTLRLAEQQAKIAKEIADRERKRLDDAEESFGKLDALQQARFKRLDKKLARGESLTRGELTEADKIGVNPEKVKEEFRRRAREAGFGDTSTGKGLRDRVADADRRSEQAIKAEAALKIEVEVKERDIEQLGKEIAQMIKASERDIAHLVRTAVADAFAAKSIAGEAARRATR